MKHKCKCGNDDSQGGCISGRTGEFTCKECVDKLRGKSNDK